MTLRQVHFSQNVCTCHICLHLDPSKVYVQLNALFRYLGVLALGPVCE